MSKTVFREFIEQIRRFGLEFTGRHYSVYRGFVSDNNDPDFLGRLKITCPGVLGDTVSGWAWPRGIMAGKGHGGYVIPSVGDPVYISFEAGDARYPLWEYGWFMANQTPAGVQGRAKPDLYLFQTPAGNRAEIDDKKGTITLKNKAGFIIEAGPAGISLKNGSGQSLSGILKKLTQACAKITVTPATLGAPTPPPNNVAEFVNLVAEIEQLLN